MISITQIDSRTLDLKILCKNLAESNFLREIKAITRKSHFAEREEEEKI